MRNKKVSGFKWSMSEASWSGSDGAQWFACIHIQRLTAGVTTFETDKTAKPINELFRNKHHQDGAIFLEVYYKDPQDNENQASEWTIQTYVKLAKILT